ncbi:MAG: hypothetical protein RMY28_002965 [Nostoc sp. ChiSLP01]
MNYPSNWLNKANGAIRKSTQEVATLLNLPPFVFPIFGLCVGYPNSEVQAAMKPRLPQPAVFHRETYKLAEQDEAIARYNDIMKQFYTEQNMNVAVDWSQHSAERIATLDYLKGCKYVLIQKAEGRGEPTFKNVGLK